MSISPTRLEASEGRYCIECITPYPPICSPVPGIRLVFSRCQLEEKLDGMRERAEKLRVGLLGLF